MGEKTSHLPTFAKAVPVPPWADPEEADPFDGSMPQEVGLYGVPNVWGDRLGNELKRLRAS